MMYLSTGRMNSTKDMKRPKRSQEHNQTPEEKNPNVRHTLYLVNILFLCFLTMAAIVTACFFFLRNRQLTTELSRTRNELDKMQGEDQTLFTSEQLKAHVDQASESAARAQKNSMLMQIQSSLESGNSTTSMLRELFSDELVVVSQGRYYFYPVISSLPKNSFEKGDFEQDAAGFLNYKGSDATISVKQGIDVSENNGDIDFDQVAQSGISYVMVCLGERDASGKITEDENALDNISAAAKAGLDVGAYFTSSPVSADEAMAEAEYVTGKLDKVKDSITMPVAVQIEVADNTDRTAKVTKADYTTNLISLCDAIEAKGYTPAVFGSLAAFTMRTDLTRIEDIDKWVQDLSNNLYFPYEFTMWQYSNAGQIQGINGDVDLNLEVTHAGNSGKENS